MNSKNSTPLTNMPPADSLGLEGLCLACPLPACRGTHHQGCILAQTRANSQWQTQGLLPDEAYRPGRRQKRGPSQLQWLLLLRKGPSQRPMLVSDVTRHGQLVHVWYLGCGLRLESSQMLLQAPAVKVFR